MNQDTGFHADFVFCIDATVSMGRFISEFRSFIPSLHSKVRQSFAENGTELSTLRVRFIFFRDYGYDSEPMTESVFFSLPEDTEEMMSFLGHVEGEGGGDRPESVLEAIALAINSEWKNERRVRQAVVVFTDASPHPLGTHSAKPCYPEEMPKSFEELTALWEENGEGGYRRSKSRLIAFSPPDSTLYEQVSGWSGSFGVHVDPSEMTAVELCDIFGSIFPFLA